MAFLDGYKTYVGIAIAVLGFALHYVIDADTANALLVAGLGLAGIGAGHKLDKLCDLLSQLNTIEIEMLPPHDDSEKNAGAIEPAPGQGPLHFGCAILALALAPAMSYADAPRAVINGPTAAIPGELVTLDASGSNGAPTHYKWSINPEVKGRRQLTADGAKCTVASFPGTYVVTLVVGNADGVDLLTWRLDIPGNPPTPCPDPAPQPLPPAPVPIPPVPTPTPIPEPIVIVPEGEFGIAPAIYKIAKGKPRAEIKALADKAEAMSAKIRSGSVGSMQSVLNEIVAVLKALPPGWDDLKQAARIAIEALYKAGKLNDLPAWGRLLIEIAGALLLAAA
jgi:hypothetical protein